MYTSGSSQRREKETEIAEKVKSKGNKTKQNRKNSKTIDCMGLFSSPVAITVELIQFENQIMKDSFWVCNWAGELHFNCSEW